MLLKEIKNRFFLKTILVVSFFAVGFFNICWSDEELIEITDEIWSDNKVIDGHYVLKSGQLNISKGTEILFKDDSSITVEGGVINASGTVKDPIVFTSYSGDRNGFNIKSESGGGIYFKNVHISQGGFILEDEEPGFLSWMISKVYAKDYSNLAGAISSIGGSFLVMDNCHIFDNEIGILVTKMNRETDYVSVNRCRFYDNNKSVVENQNSIPFVNFRYNWWEKENYEGLIFRDPEKSKKDFKDPVLIIPGIMGSWEKNGKLVIDPIMHTFDDLIEAFEDEGYVEGVDLFPFPYEWRDSNIDNAILLKDRINEIKQQTSSNRVDIVAHSMGGLLVREYIQSDYYQVDIDQLITLGTPHNGSPASYPRWEAGTFKLQKLDLFGTIGEKIFEQEAEEEGYDNLFDYVQNRPIDSVRELLPVYDYLYNKEEKENKNYPSGYPGNDFLENLNDSKISYLAGLEYMNVVGEKKEKSTISGYKVIDAEEDGKWEHGYPDDFGALFGDRGIIYGNGDETVPLESAQLVDEYATYVATLDSSHNQLPTKSQCEVLYFLTGNKVCIYKDNIQIPNTFLLFQVFSPIDILVTLEDGRRIGTDLETGDFINEIEGAYYSGNKTDSEFITIPNYDDQNYRIEAVGTDNGEFKVEVTSFEDNDDGETTENLIDEWQGVAVEDEIQNFEFSIGEVSISKTQEEGDDDDDGDDDDEEEGKKDEDEDDDDDDEVNSGNDGDVEILLADNRYEENIFGNQVALKDELNEIDSDFLGNNREIKVAGEINNRNYRGVIISIFLTMLIGLSLLTFWKIKTK